jgi:predicted transcriptional regulator of viral defense system
MNSNIGGLRRKGRFLLATLLKAVPETITVAAAARALDLNSKTTAGLLAAWAERGWLSRIQRGLYMRVPLQSTTTEIIPEEPRLIATILFNPCYIGGWSASEHWNLTEQVFNTIVVLTTKKVHKRTVKIKGMHFQIKTISNKRLFGTRSVWAGNSKIDISDPTKTIIDCINDPAIAGGIRMTADFLKNYLSSKEKNTTLLLEYAEKMNNSAIYKRLGYLLETYFPDEKELIATCREKMKRGYSQLDPTSAGKKLITKWGLWMSTQKTGKLQDDQ